MPDSKSIPIDIFPELTEIGIENFKSFGPRQTVTFSRVNFLFGPNSHGKTSVIAAISLLFNSYLDRNFTRGSVEYIDNSPPFDLTEELINRNTDSDAYMLEIKRKVFFPRDLFKHEILHRFFLNPAKKGNLQKYQAFEVAKEGLVMIVEVEKDRLIINSDSEFFKGFGERIISQLGISGDGLFAFKEEDFGVNMLSLQAGNKPPKEFRNNIEDDGEEEYYVFENKFNIGDFEKIKDKKVMFSNLLLDMLFNGTETFTMESIYYGQSDSIAFIGPNRKVPKNSYIIKGQEEFLSKEYFKEEYVNELNSWLSKSNLFDFSYEFVLNKGERNETSFERFPVQSVIEYGVREKNGQKMLKLSEVGSGIGHIFQILLPLFSHIKVVVIQQPEIHLHPSMQVQLAKALINISYEKDIQLVIETHSEHFIKAAQLEVARSNSLKNSALTKEDLNVIYVSKNKDGHSIVRDIEVDDFGAFKEPWPDDFFELSGDLSLERLRFAYQKRN